MNCLATQTAQITKRQGKSQKKSARIKVSVPQLITECHNRFSILQNGDGLVSLPDVQS